MEHIGSSVGKAPTKDRLLFIPALLLTIVALVVIFAITTAGGKTDPLDAKRMADLETIVSAVRLYAAANNDMFPESLDILVTNKYLAHEYLDPETHKPYRYLRMEGKSFSVCATVSDGSNRCISSKAKE